MPEESRRKKVTVLDKTSGEIVEIEPIKVWELGPRNKVKIKVGLFVSPITGKYFRARVSDDY